MRSSREMAIRADNDKFKESMATMKRERDNCMEEAATISKGLADIEDVYNSESYDVVLSAEAAQMDRLISVVEMNSLKACSALEDVNSELQKLAMEEMESKKEESSMTQQADEDFMSPLDTEAAQRASRTRAEAAAVKLRDIFHKANAQYNHVLANMAIASQDQSEDILEERPPAHDTENDQRQVALVAMLQKRVKEVKKELEISEGQCRSLIAQRAADKRKADEEKSRYEKESQNLMNKLQLSESKKRFHEQINRDDNHYVSVISPMEFEEIKKECEDLKGEISKLEEDVKLKDTAVLQMTQDIATAQYNLQTSEHAKVKLASKLEELQKKENLTQERMAEVIDQCDAKIKAMDARVEEELRDARYKLKELAGLKREKERLTKFLADMEEKEKSVRAQSKEFMQQLSDARKRIASLEEQITDQENDYARSLEEADAKKEQEWQDEVNGLADQIKDLETENSSLKDSLESVNGRYIQQISDLTTKVEDNQIQLREKDANIANLLEKLGKTMDDYVPIKVAKETVDEEVGTDTADVNQKSAPTEVVREVHVVDQAAIEALSAKHQKEIKDWKAKHGALEKAYDSLNEALAAYRSIPTSAPIPAPVPVVDDATATDSPRQEILVETSVDIQKPILQVKPMKLNSKDRTISKGGSGAIYSQGSSETEIGERKPAVEMVSASIQTDPITLETHLSQTVKQTPSPSPSSPPSSLSVSNREVLAKPETVTAIVQTDPVVFVAEDEATQTRPSNDQQKNSVAGGDSSVQSEANSAPREKPTSTVKIEEITDQSASSTSPKTAVDTSTSNAKDIARDEESKTTKPTALSDAEVQEIIKAEVSKRILGSSLGKIPLREAFQGEDDDTDYIENIGNLVSDTMSTRNSPLVRTAAESGDSVAIEKEVGNVLKILTKGVSSYHNAVQASRMRPSSGNASDSDSDSDDEDDEESVSSEPVPSGGGDGKPSDIDNGERELKVDYKDDSSSVVKSSADDDGRSIMSVGDVDGDETTAKMRLRKSKKKKKRAHHTSTTTTDDSDSLDLSVVDEPKKNDNKYNLPDDEDDMSVEIEVERRLSVLDKVEDEDKLKAAEAEIARLNAELVELRLSHESIYEQLQRALEKKDDEDDDDPEIFRVNSGVSEMSEISGRVSKVGFDASKFLAMASRDGSEDKRKSRAQILLEQSRAPEIDRSQAQSPNVSTVNSAENTRLSPSTLPTVKDADFDDDDEISALGDDLSEFGNMLHRSPSLELAINEGGGESVVLNRERKRIEELLSEEDAQSFGMIKSENFDRLRDGPFGGNDIVHLTRLEYYYKSLASDDDNTSDGGSVAGSVGARRVGGAAGSKLGQVASTRKRISHKTRIQATAARIEVDAQRVLIVEKYPVKDLVRYLTVTENTLIKLSTFGVWKRMQHAASGGLFHDILVVHRDNLNRCITDAGGYSQAMLNVQIENQLDADTTFWPDFFRVKVLEYYRKELFSLEKIHEKERDDLNADIDKLRNDLQEEKDLVIAERAWALKEISAMSVHLKKRLTMSRGSSVFQDMDLKDLAETLPDDDDDKRSSEKLDLPKKKSLPPGIFSGDFTESELVDADKDHGETAAESETEEGSTPKVKIKKKVGFAESSQGEKYAPRLYEENSAFFLKAKEIQKSLKAKTFFKKIINSRMMFSSFAKKKESIDEFGEQLKEDAEKESESELESELDKVKPSRPSQMLAMSAFGINPKTDTPVGAVGEVPASDEADAYKADEDTAPDDVAEPVEDTTGKEQEHGEGDGAEGEEGESEYDDDDEEGVEDEDEEEGEEYDQIASIPKKEVIMRMKKPLVRQGSRKIERIVIDITKLQLQIQDIAIAVYKTRNEQAAVLAQSLSSVLFNWEKVDSTAISLDACLSLCRPDSQDQQCILSLKNFAKARNCNMQLSDLMPARDALLDCVQYFERVERPIPRRQSSVSSLVGDDESDKGDPSPPATPERGRSRGGTFRVEGGGGTCGNCGAKISLADMPMPSPKGSNAGKVLFSSSPASTDSSGQRRRALSQPNSPSSSSQRKKPVVEFVVKKKKSLPIEKPVVEETVKLMDHKSCQTETNEEVVVSFQTTEDPEPLASVVNSREPAEEDIPPAMSDTMLVKLEDDIWDCITPDTTIIDAPFSQYGVEISPGIRMVSNYVRKAVEPEINPTDPDLPPLNEGETENVLLPHGVVLVRKRKSFTPLFKGITVWDEWDSINVPRPDFPEDVVAVEVPSVMDISPNVQLFAGGYLNYSIELPTNVWMLSLFREQDSSGAGTYFGELDSLIPAGFVMVRLAESLVVSKDLTARLPVGVTLVEIAPHKLVQLNGRYATLPEGLMLSPGIMLATAECAPPPKKEVVYFSFNDKSKDAESGPDECNIENIPAPRSPPPPLILRANSGASGKGEGNNSEDGDDSKKEENLIPLVLPPGIICVYVDESAEWPQFLTKLKLEGEPVEAPVDDVDISAQSDAEVFLMKSSLVILKNPPGITLPPGSVLVKRPRSMNGILRPLPPGLRLCPPHLIPERLTLRNGVELALLTPIYELPVGLKITPDAVVYQRPVGMKIPRNTALVRRSPVCTVPAGVTVAPLPDVPFGVYLPQEVELWEFPDLRLPVHAELVDGVNIAETPPIPENQVLQEGVLFIRRQHWAMNAVLPPGFERALKQHLPAKCLLPAGVEAVFIRPRYELPAGVQLQPGAVLQTDIQLPPGSEIMPNIEVVEWPQGMFIPANLELVRRIDRDASLPSDIVVVQESAIEFKAVDTTRVICSPPRGCFFIRLPQKVNLPSVFDLVDRIMVMPLVVPGAPHEAEMVELQRSLPENVVAIKKVPPSKASVRPLSPLGNIPFPPELTPYPSALLPKDCHLPVGIELVYVHSFLDLPEGTVLKGGFTVKNRLQNLAIPPELIPLHNEGSDTSHFPPEITLYPCQELLTGHFGMYPTSINDVVQSWGVGLEPMSPAEPPGDMKKLPEGHFLVDLTKVGERLDSLPAALEIVHNVASLPAGILLPPQTIVVRLKPRVWLPFGIRVFDMKDIPEKMQLCPGEPLDDTNVEVNFFPVGKSFRPSEVHVVKLEKQSVKEDTIDVSQRTHVTIHERLAKWFRNYRMSTIGVSVRGHGGYIQGTIPAPSDSFSSLAEIMRVPSRGVLSRGLSSRGSRAPLSKNSSRTISEKDVMEAFNAGHEEDLQMANEQIEKLNDTLEESYKEVRMLKRSVDSGAKELELARAKYDRLETFRDNLMEELDRVRASLDKLKAQEKKDDTAHRVKIMDLTAQTRNQAFTISEFEDKIKAYEDKIAHMRANGGKSKNDQRKDAMKRERDINAAREEALNEYRKLLKISVRTAYQLVMAIVSAAEKDRHLLAYSVSQKANHVEHHFMPPNSADDLSQLTMEEDDEMSLLSSHMVDDEPSLTGKSVGFQLDSTPEGSVDMSKSMPILRAGTAKSSKGGGMGMSSNRSTSGRSTADSVMSGRTSATGKKRSVRPVVKSFKQMPGISVDESPIYAIAATLVDRTQEDSGSIATRPSLKSQGTSRASTSHANVFMTTGSKPPSVSTHRRRVGTADTVRPKAASLNLDAMREFPNDSILSLELVEPEVLKSSDYHHPSKISLTMNDILPEKLIADLESTFELSQTAVSKSDDPSFPQGATVRAYIVDTAAADAIASEWLKNAVALSITAVSNTLGNYVTAFHLLESEIDTHIAEITRLHKKLKHAEGKYEDVVSTSDVPLEQRMQYRLDELNKSLVQMYGHSHNMRNMSHQSFLEVLQNKSTEISDLLEQEHRLELSAIVVKKKAQSEENRLKRGEFEEKERVAITHYVDALRKRAVVLSNRAETVKSCCQDIASSIKTELEAFEGAVQNVLPPRIITKVLNWGISHSNKAIRDSQVPTSTGAVGAPQKPALSTIQSLPLLRPSPSLPGTIVRQGSSSNDSASSSSDMNKKKKLPAVKADPFNRYFISGNGSNRKNSDPRAHM